MIYRHKKDGSKILEEKQKELEKIAIGESFTHNGTKNHSLTFLVPMNKLVNVLSLD